MTGRRRLLLCAGPAAISLTDLTVTLCGQSAEYWAGDYSQVTEGNPLPRWLLEQHPATLIAAIAVWIVVFCVAICRLSERPARIVSGVIVLGHALAVVTWWVNSGIGGYIGIAVLMVAAWFYARLTEPEQSSASIE